MGRCDQGIKFAQFSKCSDGDENSAIASVSFSRFRRYIYFREWSPYGGDIAILPSSQKGQIWVLTVPVRTVRTATWRAVPFADMAEGWSGTHRLVVCCPIICWHVSLHLWFIWLCKKILLESRGFEPGTSHTTYDLTNSASQHTRTCSLYKKWADLLLRLCVRLIWKGAGRGLSPDP